MAVRKYKPTSPGRRDMTVVDLSDLSSSRPERALTKGIKRSGGRNNTGRITVYQRGGGHKRRYRRIDFKRDKPGVPARVASIEYDPNRSARIALLHYADGEKRYILAPVGLRAGDTLVAGERAEIRPGNALPLRSLPMGTVVHNIEFKPGKGGQLCRSAGSGAQLMAREGKYATLKLPSGEMRRFLVGCLATVGQIGNVEHRGIKLGKAGRTRWLGRRPKVRGSAMTPRDHPHGGGEGRAPRGMAPKTPWGKPALGYRTRKLVPVDA